MMIIATVMIVFGILKMFMAQVRMTPKTHWLVLLVVTSACLADIQPWFFKDWSERLNFVGPGGWVGWFVGGQFLENAFGYIGTAILLGLVYLLTLILLTGLSPVYVAKRSMVGFGSLSLLLGRKVAGVARLKDTKRLEHEGDETETTATRTAVDDKSKRNTRRKPKAEPVAEEAPVEEKPAAASASAKKKAAETKEDEFSDVPEIEIIDASAPAKKAADPENAAATGTADEASAGNARGKPLASKGSSSGSTALVRRKRPALQLRGVLWGIASPPLIALKSARPPVKR
jgi:hypothetical protein